MHKTKCVALCRIKWTLPDRDAADDAQQLTQELLDKGELHKW